METLLLANMKLKRIALTNFRNYSEVSVDTDADLVLILGPNASGKTNFLESIYYLSRLKSFRASDNLLVKSQEDYFKIAGIFGDKNLEAVVQINPKLARQFKIDDLKVKRVNWKTFTTVLFVPQDLNLFELGPNLRRGFLNHTLSQVNFNYAMDLESLDRVLKQRSALLTQIFEGQATESELQVWNLELANLSLRITKGRKEFVEALNSQINEIYKNLSDFNSKIEVQYDNIGVGSAEDFLAKLATYKSAEIRIGQNLYGPHRDDFTIKKDGQLNLENSSRGELRAQVLALKLLQAKFLDQHKLEPVILLDDVFSELDEIRRTKLLQTLSGHQIFITTTEEHHLPALQKQTKFLRVLNSQIL